MHSLCQIVGWPRRIRGALLMACGCRKHHRFRRIATILGASWLGCSILNGDTGEVFRPDGLRRLDDSIRQAIAERNLPGAVLWLEHRGVVHQGCFGEQAILPSSEPMRPDTIFDISSLTKVVATAPAVMLLVERGQLVLDAPVCRYLPEWKAVGAEQVTIRHLLTHTSGLLVGISGASFTNTAGAMAVAYRESPRVKPGREFHYCDLNYILLGEVVRSVGGRSLDAFVADSLYRPLGMVDTGFCPAVGTWKRVAPTQRMPEGLLRGVVHDLTARRMEGVAGHAGLFSTAIDLARFARMFLREGELDGVRIFRPETIRMMTSVQSPASVVVRRGLGWDIDSGFSRPRGVIFPLGSYGHSGFSGAMIWVDPFSQTFVVMLTNRLHPEGKGNVVELYARVSSLAAAAVADFDFSQVRGALPFRTNFISWGSLTNLLPIQP